LQGTVRQGGRVTLSGPISLAPPFGADLEIRLFRAALREPEVFSTRADGRLSITGPLAGGATIGGRLELGATEVRVAPSGLTSLGVLPDINHVNPPQAVTATRRRADLVAETTQSAPAYPLDLTVSAPNQIFVRGRGLDAELGGRLRLTGTTADVRPSGMFELIRGRLDILGKRLTLTEGRVTLRGTFDPFLRFVAETRADDITVQIVIEGLSSEPEITFRSQPGLPEEEVAARLLFGRSLSEISPFQAAQLASAVAELSGRGGAGMLGRLRRNTGLSDLDVGTTEDGATELRLGKYISDNVYSEVTATSEGEQEINLNLDLSRNLTIKGHASSQGDTGIGIFYERDY
jgi:translocation and assembly module TamB